MPSPNRDISFKGAHGGVSLAMAPSLSCHEKTVSTWALILVFFIKTSVFMSSLNHKTVIDLAGLIL